ncbi:MAG: bifunctional diguanylate cyclase/phosphodiesterase [Gammaproteobacteria bacterium]|nr:bifunctional diguanylate cyclase/phosphodiesterase [Gammaproteobacteria bacterium]
MTTTDELTGLYDRKGFLKLLSGQVKDANTYKTKLALLIVDINRFYRINNIYGYEAGDEILKKIALVLRNVIREQDYVARIGDNRFALILSGIMNVGHAELAAHKILRLLQAPFLFGDRKIYVDCTIGISLCPLHASNYMFLMKECESVLHGAKEKGRTIGISETLEDEEIPEDWDIELALDDALDKDQLQIHYQPKIALDSGGVVGVEALLRWNHPSRGFIPPNYFIPIAERMGHIKPITNWIFNTALRQGSEWTDKWGPLSIAVNIPPDFILMPDLKDLIANAMNLWGGDNVSPVLEIVERSLVLEPEKSFSILRELQEMGIGISIDDFGTGYSSLSYFEKLPVNELKIDQSFVTNVVGSPANQNIVKLIVDLAHAFDMEVVAEGVEDLGALQYLKKIKCDLAQGYYFAKPMPQEQIKDWLSNFAGLK